MSGKIMAIFFAALLLLGGAGLYYLQVYYYYREVPAAEIPTAMTLVGADGQPVSIPVSGFKGIYSVSTPIGNRACFTTTPAEAAAAEPYDKPTPLGAPSWFGCFDYGQITDDIESGAAKAYLGQKNIAPKIDNVIAVYPDGRAYEWRQPNEEAEEKRTID
ncbi:DUF6446 family protein [Paracoccus aminophilus]|uniref:Histidine kinase n=1 Tax=Paracoccus aminophilus JCM 7686 TaxID=1367847 RepID=S5XWK8_PARAH|nr:DUF6446 family protein [Paracoccus aminophilus]AGT09672.1 hypothetical protein JCM7686_2604 [Paracoccus aminophilus JCM 7686]